MKNNLYSLEIQKKLKANVEKNYRNFIEDIREDFKNGFSTDVVDPQFLDQLNDIIHDEVFDNYSPLKFYWINLLDNLIYLIQLHEEILSSESFNESNEELSQTEEELLHLWQNSELAEQFLDIFNDGLPVLEASDQLLPLLENQIISFYVLHINQYQQEFDDALIYQALPELGEFEKRLYLGDGHHIVDLQKIPDSFPSLPIKAFRPEQLELWLEVKEEDIKNKIKLNAPSIEIENFSLFVLPGCEEGLKKHKELVSKLDTALKKIKTTSPHLFDTFKSFTHTIVPIKEPNIISYSMQSLPGVSLINMFKCDQIDLMDDLLHENGHHYLNTYLNHTDLVNDEDKKTYYCPWKKELFPIREIYQNAFTSFWAFELFFNLLHAVDTKKVTFTKEETLKIQTRFVEEYYMLNYCWTDLNQAFKDKAITKEGFELISDVYKQIQKAEKLVSETEKTLPESGLKSLVALKSDLKDRRTY